MRNDVQGNMARMWCGAILVLLAGCVLGALRAQAPQWWGQRQVALADKAPDDFAFINQGQLKQFALAALGELEQRLEGGAGAELRALLNAWTQLDANGERVPLGSPQADDYAPVNIGQLKAVALPFRERLAQAGLELSSPFTETASDDFALATIGQAKNLFDLDFSLLDNAQPALQRGPDGAALTWKLDNPDDTYTVFGVGRDADTPALTILARDVKIGAYALSEESLKLYKQFAIQRKRKGMFSALVLVYEILSNSKSQPDSLPRFPVPDSDGDGVPDDRDAWPADPEFAPPKVTSLAYGVLPLPTGVRWTLLNAKGSVAGESLRGAEFWTNGHLELIREDARVIAMNDRDQVLVRYQRPARPEEYDINIVRWVFQEALQTRQFLGPDAEDSGEEWYPLGSEQPQSEGPTEEDPLRVSVCAVWSPWEGIREVVEIRDVSVGGRWPRWSNGSRLFSMDAQFIDNEGVVYGTTRLSLLFGWGSADPIGAFSRIIENEANTSPFFVPWQDQPRWRRAEGQNFWSPGGGGFGFRIVPSAGDIGLSKRNWYQAVSPGGHVVVSRWSEELGKYESEVDGVAIPEPGLVAEIHDPLEKNAGPVLYVAHGPAGEGLWMASKGAWRRRTPGRGDVRWGLSGSLLSRIQATELKMPARWRVSPGLAVDSGLMLVGIQRIASDDAEGAFASGTNGDLADSTAVEALALPITPASSELYMFSGHDRDVVALSAAPTTELNCTWKLREEARAPGYFSLGESDIWLPSVASRTTRFRAGRDGEPDIAGHARAQSPGRNVIELWSNGVLVHEIALEVVAIHSRKAWGAIPPNLRELEGMASLDALTVHHTSRDAFGADEVRRIQKKHKGQGWLNAFHPKWADIGYHFILDPSEADFGSPVALFEARQIEGYTLKGGPWTKGSGVLMRNTLAGVNLCVMGDYSRTDAHFDGLRLQHLERAVTAIFRRYEIPPGILRSHCGLASIPEQEEYTECPGAGLLDRVREVEFRSKILQNLR